MKLKAAFKLLLIFLIILVALPWKSYSIIDWEGASTVVVKMLSNNPAIVEYSNITFYNGSVLVDSGEVGFVKLDDIAVLDNERFHSITIDSSLPTSASLSVDILDAVTKNLITNLSSSDPLTIIDTTQITQKDIYLVITVNNPSADKAALNSVIFNKEEVYTVPEDSLIAVPNPFDLSKDSEATIIVNLEEDSTVFLAVYSLSGGMVNILADNETFLAGKTQVYWDGRGMDYYQLPSGIYILYLNAHSLVSGKVVRATYQLVLVNPDY